MSARTAGARLFAPTAAAATARFGVVAVPALVAAAVYALALSDHASVALLGTCALLVAVFPLVRRAHPGGLHVLEPVVPASVLLALLFGARPLAMLGSEELAFRGYEIEPFFERTVLLGLLGTAAFVVAYELVGSPTGAATVETPRVTPLRRLRLIVAGAAALSVALFGLHLSRGPSIVETLRLLTKGRSDELAAVYESSSEYLSSSPLLLACAAIAAVAVTRWRRLRWGDRVLVAAAAIVPALVFLMLGNRRFLIPCLALPVVVALLARRRRPPVLPVLLAAPLVFVLLATIPYARSAGAREQAGGAVPIFRDAFLHPGRTWSRFIRGPDTEAVSALAIEVEVLRAPGDFFYGRATVGDVLLAPVPSAIVRGKPTTARDELLVRAFGRPCVVRTGGSCPNFSVVGTFYQDFWLLGVLVGMAALGAAAALVWRLYLERPGSAYRAVAAGCTAVFLPIMIRAGFMPPFAWFLYFLLPSLLAVRLATGGPAREPLVAAREPA